MSNIIRSILLSACTVISAGAFAASSLPADVTPAEQKRVEQIVRNYLVNNPEVMIEVMQALQEKQNAKVEETIKTTELAAPKFTNELFRNKADPSAGNPNGKITITEFFDYQCSYCVTMSPTLDALVKANNNVRVVYKEFPIRGPVSVLAARAALAANKQGKYMDLHKKLLASQQPLSEAVIMKLAQSVGLNMTQFKKDMNDKVVQAELDANLQLGQKQLQLFGTPAFFIGKTDANNKSTVQYAPGRLTLAELQSRVAAVK